MIELRGHQTLLRALEREHCRILWEVYEPVQPIPTEPLNPGLSVEGANTWFETIQARQGREQVYLGIFTHAGVLVGDIQLADIDWRNRTASLGLSIARLSDRGKGYGLDATQVIIRYAFEQLDLVRLRAATLEYNQGALRILEKCGFALEGRERQAVICNGKRWDRLLYGLLRDEFQQGATPS